MGPDSYIPEMMKKNEPILIEYFDDHYYKVKIGDNQFDYFPSITTKLQVVNKPAVNRWASDVGTREAEYKKFMASQRGKRIHHAWSTLTMGGVVVYNPWEKPVFTRSELDELRKNSFDLFVMEYQNEYIAVWKLMRWIEEVKPRPMVQSETIFYSMKYREGCTVDNIFYLNPGHYDVNGRNGLTIEEEGLYICDLKSGNYTDEDHFLQLAGNMNCFQETTGEDLKGGFLIHTESKNRSGIEGLATIFRTKEQLQEDFLDFRHAAALYERKYAKARPKTFEFPAMLEWRQ